MKHNFLNIQNFHEKSVVVFFNCNSESKSFVKKIKSEYTIKFFITITEIYNIVVCVSGDEWG